MRSKYRKLIPLLIIATAIATCLVHLCRVPRLLPLAHALLTTFCVDPLRVLTSAALLVMAIFAAARSMWITSAALALGSGLIYKLPQLLGF